MLIQKSLLNKNLDFLSQRGFIVGLLSISFVFVINVICKHFFTNYVPMSLFLGSVVIAAWIAGTRGGLYATLLGAVFEFLFFSEATLLNLHHTEIIRVAVYLLQGVLISWIFGEFHNSQLQVAYSEKQLSMAFDREKKARTLAERALDELKFSQKQLSEEREIAKNANRVKTLFLAHMSHEIRTPLMAILGFADLLKDTSLTDAERRNYLGIIERTGNNLKDIINDILDISKVEAGHFEIDFIPFSLQDLLEEVHAVFSLKCSDKNLSLEFTPDGEVPNFVMTDPKRLRQILINLLGNSIKFTDKGYVRMTYRAEKSQLVFLLEDTGIGITEEQKSKLFENFSQGDNSVSRRFAGTGLGLALSRKLAKMLGGNVELVSSDLNQGSTFEIRIGYTAAPERTTSASKQFQANFPQKYDGKKVLVVDDSPDNRLLLERTLSKLGIEVMTASDGVEALTLTEHNKFDLILMDMQMPVMDGYSATQHLREKKCQTPVIALTAHALKEDRLKCLQAGCDDYLSKPLQKDQLYQLLKTHCQI